MCCPEINIDAAKCGPETHSFFVYLVHQEEHCPVKTVLEAVPPERHRGEAAVEAVVEKVAQVHAARPLDRVNIPEIHEEPARSQKGERRKPFEPRMAPRALGQLIQERLGIPCMINHVVVHQRSADLLDWCRETWSEYGIREFVLVGGGLADTVYPGPTVPEASRLMRDALTIPELRVGNICIPSREDEAARMAAKTAAGADFFTTQILYEPDHFTHLLDEMARIGETADEVLLAFCPVRSLRNIRFLLWLGVSIPDALEAWLTEVDDAVPQRSLEQIRRTWADIIDHQREAGRPRPRLGVNLAPIGAVAPQTTIGLARDLVAMHDQSLNAV